jgi:hypothetical protein
MKVEIEMYIDEDDEALVMQKTSLTKQAKDAGFKIAEIEFKRSRHKEDEDKHHNKHDDKYHNDNIGNNIPKNQ